VSGVKGDWPSSSTATTAHVEKKPRRSKHRCPRSRASKIWAIFRHCRPAQPQLHVDRDAAAAGAIKRADIQEQCRPPWRYAPYAGAAGRGRYDVTLRYQKQYRDTREAIESVRLLRPPASGVSLAQLTKASTATAPSRSREGGQRYIAIKYSVRGRDLGQPSGSHRQGERESGRCRTGYHLELGRVIREAKKSAADQAAWQYCSVTVLGHLPHPLHHVPLLQVGHAHSHQGGMASIGGPLALLITVLTSGLFRGPDPRASSASRWRLASSWSSLLTSCAPAARDGRVAEEPLWKPQWRLCPSAASGDDDHAGATLGLLPAALLHAIGSDSQRPFASSSSAACWPTWSSGVFLLPTLYVWRPREDDVLPAAE